MKQHSFEQSHDLQEIQSYNRVGEIIPLPETYLQSVDLQVIRLMLRVDETVDLAVLVGVCSGDGGDDKMQQRKSEDKYPHNDPHNITIS